MGMKLPKENEVHVWKALVSECTSSLSTLSQVLSSEEVDKAARFRRAEDRNRSIVARGVLRHLLGRYLSKAPRDLVFMVNAFGKPTLSPQSDLSLVHFNLAHSGDVVLFAVALNCAVGVDVEMIRADLEVVNLARSHFSPEERAALEGTPSREKTEAFFRCWTRKEACVKAWGQGLSFPLDKFSVSLGRNEVPRLTWIDAKGMPAKKWTLFHLEPEPGYLGAVAVEGPDARLISSDWAFFPAVNSAKF